MAELEALNEQAVQGGNGGGSQPADASQGGELAKQLEEAEELNDELRAAVEQRDGIIAKAKEMFLEQKSKFQIHLETVTASKDEEIQIL